MDVRNCKSCGKIYKHLYAAQPFCPSCMSKLDESFKLVKEYIYDHPNAGVQEVSDEFNISVSIIHGWVREERLAFADNSPMGIECEKCGATIKTGRYCKRCQMELANTFANAYKPERQVDEDGRTLLKNAKMRFIR